MRKNQTRAGLGFFVVSALALGVGATACDFIAGGKELDLAYCQAHPAEPACADYCMTHSGAGCPDGRPAVDAPTSCTSNVECSGTATVCDVAGTNACVLCTATDHAACTGVTPVCSDDKAACRACVADADCASGVCRDDGSCAAAASVIMVAINGSGSACNLNMPCTLAIGVGKISAAKNVLHVAPGVYEVNSGLTLSTDVTVTGRGATLDRSSGTPGPVVSSTAAVVWPVAQTDSHDVAVGCPRSRQGTRPVSAHPELHRHPRTPNRRGSVCADRSRSCCRRHGPLGKVSPRH